MIRLLYGVAWGVMSLIWVAGCANQLPPEAVSGSPVEPAAAGDAAANTTLVMASGPTVEREPVGTETSASGSQPSRPGSRDRVATFVLAPGETTLSYTITESVMYDWGRPATVTGSTRAVEGQFMLDYDYPSHSRFSPITANVRTLQSDEPARDQTLQEEWLESERYPLAVFMAKEVRDFPSGALPGQPIRFQLAGDLTIHEVTRPVIWDVTGNLSVDRLTGKATTWLRLTDFSVPPPYLPGVLTVVDGVSVTLDFTFKTTNPTPPTCG